MNNPIAKYLFTLLLVAPLLAFEKQGLLDSPMPLLANKTLDGKSIDENYYKGHVTVVSFMYIGCYPCMMEITTLNKIKEDYRNNEQVQVLCVARQLKGQMVHFNATDTTLFSKIRKALNADSIQYAIQPGCSAEKSAMEKDGNHVSLKSECSTLEDIYGITGYPTIFLVDKNGIVRYIHKGASSKKDDPVFIKLLKEQIDALATR